jgi:hypothetical protein
MINPDFELAVEKAMEEINAMATCHPRIQVRGLFCFPVPNNQITREAALRILVERAAKKVLQFDSEPPEPELQKLKQQIRSEFEKMYTELEGAGDDFLFPSE